MSNLVRICPFCSSESIEYHTNFDDAVHFYHCMFCNADGPVGETDEEALDLWNTRVEGPPVSDPDLIIENILADLETAAEEVLKKHIALISFVEDGK